MAGLKGHRQPQQMGVSATSRSRCEDMKMTVFPPRELASGWASVVPAVAPAHRIGGIVIWIVLPLGHRRSWSRNSVTTLRPCCCSISAGRPAVPDPALQHWLRSRPVVRLEDPGLLQVISAPYSQELAGFSPAWGAQRAGRCRC